MLEHVLVTLIRLLVFNKSAVVLQVVGSSNLRDTDLPPSVYSITQY